MPTSTNVTNLKINELTEAQYDTAVQGGVIGANEISILTDAEAGQVIQVATLPTASADELGKIYQFVGTTDANYTNGYFYKCVSDGAATPTYSWSNVQVQASSGGLPTQTGNAGKFLTTDGTDASWSDAIKGGLTLWGSGGSQSPFLKLGYVFSSSATAPNAGVKLLGQGDKLIIQKWDTPYTATLEVDVVSPGSGDTKTLGKPTSNNASWNNVYTKKINAGSGAGDITIPTVAGSMAVQVSTIPTASSTLEGQIYQFVGATDSTYTNGHFYKCVSDGQDPATYSWTEVQLGGGGSSYTAGTGIDITGGVISVTSPTLQNNAQNGKSAVAIGKGTQENNSGYYSILIDSVGGSNYATGTSSVAIKGSCDGRNNIAICGNVTGGNQGGIAIGQGATVSAASAIQICSDYNTPVTNSDANTVKIANANGNYEIMSADGTIPHARLTNAVQSTTVTIATTDWSSNTASVTVSGLTATSVVWVAPDNASQSAYTTAGVYASAQAADTLTFTCTQTPSASLTINVVFC